MASLVDTKARYWVSDKRVPTIIIVMFINYISNIKNQKCNYKGVIQIIVAPQYNITRI